MGEPSRGSDAGHRVRPDSDTPTGPPEAAGPTSPLLSLSTPGPDSTSDSDLDLDSDPDSASSGDEKGDDNSDDRNINNNDNDGDDDNDPASTRMGLGPGRNVANTCPAGPRSRPTPTPTLAAWTPSFFHPGSRFRGTQVSDMQRYSVGVEIMDVDFFRGQLTGVLDIEGLTSDHPVLTTFFDGEIVGPCHSFLTDHPDWGASPEVDYLNWTTLAGSTLFERRTGVGTGDDVGDSDGDDVDDDGDYDDDYDEHEEENDDAGARAALRRADRAIRSNRATGPTDLALGSDRIFMRWKERFLLPDYKVRTLLGASFDGYYYICLDVRTGRIDGSYYHGAGTGSSPSAVVPSLVPAPASSSGLAQARRLGRSRIAQTLPPPPPPPPPRRARPLVDTDHDTDDTDDDDDDDDDESSSSDSDSSPGLHSDDFAVAVPTATAIPIALPPPPPPPAMTTSTTTTTTATAAASATDGTWRAAIEMEREQENRRQLFRVAFGRMDRRTDRIDEYSRSLVDHIVSGLPVNAWRGRDAIDAFLDDGTGTGTRDRAGTGDDGDDGDDGGGGVLNRSWIGFTPTPPVPTMATATTTTTTTGTTTGTSTATTATARPVRPTRTSLMTAIARIARADRDRRQSLMLEHVPSRGFRPAFGVR